MPATNGDSQEFQVAALDNEIRAHDLRRKGSSARLPPGTSTTNALDISRIKLQRIRRLHRFNAIILLAFLLPHVVAHLFAVAGPAAHDAALDMVRWTYRPFLSEISLVTLLLSQIGLGVVLARSRVKAGGNKRLGWGTMQLASGGYLALFIVLHGSAALASRYINQLPTNFDWVATPLQHPVTKWLFYPYYTLAIVALMTHLGAWLAFRGHRKLAWLLPISGALFATIYLASFGGWLFPVEAPASYLSIYDEVLGRPLR